MNILGVKKVHPDAVMPEYESEGAACFDLRAVGIDSNGVNNGYMLQNAPRIFRTGLKFEIPAGFALMIYSRSGHGFKGGIRLSNCVGVIDSDYKGEVMVRLRADDAGDLHEIKNGNAIAQAMLIEVPAVRLVEVHELSESARGEGGFGSTGA